MSKVQKVLVAADERLAAKAVAAHTNRVDGFRTAGTVGSAAACLRRLADGGVDLVLLDLRKSHIAGTDLTARIAELGFAVDVILLATPDEAHRLPAGVPHIEKPLAFDVFREVLLSWSASRPTDPTPEVAPRRSLGGRRTGAVGGLPRGLRVDTLDAIAAVLRDRYQPTAVELTGIDPEGLSATSVASAIGASRFTARRYLEYLADAGVVARSLRHRTIGRPEAIYRPAPQTS